MPQKNDKEIKFFFPAQGITLGNRNRLKQYLKRILEKEGNRTVDYINYVFCSDDYLLDINKRYLQHDYFTDIITFDLSESSNAIQAEIYISIDRIKDNSRRIGTTIKAELHRVIFHGVLHLCEYRDKTKREKIKMREREGYYLENYK